MKKLLLILVLLVGCSTGDFSYKDRVSVESGFYMGQSGKIVGDLNGGTYLIQLDDGACVYIYYTCLKKEEQ